MNTSLVSILIIALIVLVAVAALATSRSRARRLEANRIEAGKARGLADMKARTAKQERLQSEDYASSAQQHQTEADELRPHAAEIDLDHAPLSRP